MRNFKKPPKLRELSFFKKEIEECKAKNKLKRISIAISLQCNLRCPYCYINAEKKRKKEISFQEIIKLIDQAKNLGVKTVTITGGEPLIYPKIKELVSYINKKKLISVIFTNSTNINEDIAKFLFKNNVSIIPKLNSFDPKIQDILTGVKNSFEKMKKGIDILIKTGFNKTKPSRLGLETIICKLNLNQIPKLFRFCRKNNIYPYFELLNLGGRGKNFHQDLTTTEAKKIFYDLLKIDKKEFGYDWIPRPPFVANTCNFLFTSLYVSSRGTIQPCPTIKIELGNIKKESLKEILEKQKTKYYRNIENIKGKCKICKYHNECYGCRGNTFNTTGDLFAHDPICWIK